MSNSKECDVNCKCFECRGKKRVTRIEEASSSDSDSPVAKDTKRKKIPRVVSDGEGSASETDSFEVVKRKKRKHAPRVMSDEEGSSGSGPRPARRKKNAPVVSESEEESNSDEYESSGIDDKEEEGVYNEGNVGETRESDDASSESWEDGEESGSGSSGWESDWTSVEEDYVDQSVDENRAVKVTVKSPGAASSGTVNPNVESDSSDGQSEKCPICLRNFASQEVGTPESCDHSFCAVCLQEWAKNMNTCPVDRQAFTLILVRSCLEGKIVRRIPVEPREHREEDEEIHEDPTPCEICGRCDHEDRLLLCDQCDSGYHLDCLDPPLDTVPIEEWFCPECVVANSTQIADEAPIGEGELFDLIDDAHATIGVSPLRRRFNRLLPRTRQSERVRSTIIRQEIERQAEVESTRPTTSSGVDSLDGASRLSMFFGSRRPAKVKKRVVRKKRKRTTKKVRKRKTTTSTKTSTKSKTTTKSQVSVTRKSGTSKRKVKRKTTRKTKRRTKKKVDNFNSDSFSSSDHSYRSVRPSTSKGSSLRKTNLDPYNHACHSKSTTTKKSSKRKMEDSDSDVGTARPSRSHKRPCATKTTHPGKVRTVVVVSDSSEDFSPTKTKASSSRFNSKKRKRSRGILIISDSSDSSGLKASLSKSKALVRKGKLQSKQAIVSDSSDSDDVSNNKACSSRSFRKTCSRKKNRPNSKPIVISDSYDSDNTSSQSSAGTTDTESSDSEASSTSSTPSSSCSFDSSSS